MRSKTGISAKRSAAARKAVRTKGPAVLHRAGLKAVASLPRGTLTKEALSRQARGAAKARSPQERHQAALKAIRTKGSAGMRQAAQKAARTRMAS